MSFKIVSDVPTPDSKKNERQQYPLEELEVGESFFVPCDSDINSLFLNINRIRMAIMRVEKKSRLKNAFINQVYHDGIRIWRQK